MLEKVEEKLSDHEMKKGKVSTPVFKQLSNHWEQVEYIL